MKVCVFSDSHGHPRRMIEAIEREKPVLCFFLGDGERDLAAVRLQFPDLPIHAVRGNCDLRSALPMHLRCAVGPLQIFAAHGHRYDVKHDPELFDLRAAALRLDCSVVLFGHTHRAYLDESPSLLVMNPGSVGGTPPSYGILQIDGRQIRPEIRYL